MIVRFDNKEEFIELLRMELGGRYFNPDDYTDKNIIELMNNGLIVVDIMGWKLTTIGKLIIGELLKTIEDKFINQDINIIQHKEGKI